MKTQDIVKIELAYNEILEALDHARKEHFLDNLRERNEFVSFDSKVRGYMGELYLKRLFTENGVKILSVDRPTKEMETDIDFEIENRQRRTLKIECKTSLVPDYYGSIPNCIKSCDIKIIRREKHYSHIPIDIHIQIYYDELRNVRDDRLSKIKGHVSSYSNEELVKLLDLTGISAYFVAWIDKDALNDYLSELPMYNRIWKFGYRSFWRCPLKISKPPKELTSFITNK